MCGWKDAWLNGWMDGWVDGWMDGWMDGWVDGWLDERKVGYGRTVPGLNIGIVSYLSLSIFMNGKHMRCTHLNHNLHICVDGVMACDAGKIKALSRSRYM